MAAESSVAPKERVNIVYRPSTGDAKQDVELSFKMLVLGDFTNSPDNRTVEDRKPINIDKDNFDDVLKASNVKTSINVANKLSSDPDAQLSVGLNFNKLSDFEPDSLIEQVPELKQIKELREALKALKGPLGNQPAFRQKIQELIKDEKAREQLLKELKIESEE